LNGTAPPVRQRGDRSLAGVPQPVEVVGLLPDVG
jgi:hypothetical protein